MMTSHVRLWFFCTRLHELCTMSAHAATASLLLFVSADAGAEEYNNAAGLLWQYLRSNKACPFKTAAVEVMMKHCSSTCASR